MYAFIEGKVEEKRQGELVLNAGGVGYLLLCSATTLAAAPANGESFRCHTVLSVREDAMELLGFATREERDLYRKITTVSGVGPRTALGVLGAMPVRDLSLAIVSGDITSLTRAPGIGKKTAQRIVLELKDKIGEGELLASSGDLSAAQSPMDAGPEQEAIEALLALGYSSQEATRAILSVRDQAQDAGSMIRLALRAIDAQ